MCLILFAYRAHPRYELVLAANRDEFYARPTAPMAFWDDAPDLLAGRDLKEGGTWLGITRGGRFAAITNYRDPGLIKPEAPSRGHLVGNFLIGQEPPGIYLERLTAVADRYNGFNLLVGDTHSLHYFSNRGGPPQALAPGFYGLSNHLLNTPWPKVRKGVAALEMLLAGPEGPAPEVLLALLQDRAHPPDGELPETGVSPEWEWMLSPLFIESATYGTRSSTVVLIERGGEVRVMDRNQDSSTVREFRLRWPTLPRPLVLGQ